MAALTLGAEVGGASTGRALRALASHERPCRHHTKTRRMGPGLLHETPHLLNDTAISFDNRFGQLKDSKVLVAMSAEARYVMQR